MSRAHNSSSESASSDDDDEDVDYLSGNDRMVSPPPPRRLVGGHREGVLVQIDPTIRRPREKLRPQCGTAHLIAEEFAKEEAKYYPTGRSSPPLLTKPNEKVKSAKKSITDLWEEDRPDKIAIFIRGPPFCGKSYLSAMIEQNEYRFNPDAKVRTINGRTEQGTFSSDRIYEDLQDAMIASMNFLIIEVKFHTIVRECVNMVMRKNYKTYGIDLFIDTQSQIFTNFASSMSDVNQFHRKIFDYLEYMEEYPMRDEVIMLNPFELYQNDFKIHLFLNNMKGNNKSYFGPTKYCDEDLVIIQLQAKKIVMDPNQMKNFPIGLELSVNIDVELSDIIAEILKKKEKNEPLSIIEKYLKELPDFYPDRVIRYDHKHKRSLEEKFSEFKLAKVYDYKHRRNAYLEDEIAYIDVDAVIEYNKEEARKKKTENYIKIGVGASDLESNPDYPNNWEVIKIEREQPGGKRKKKPNTKIKRVLEHQAREVNKVRKRVKRMKIDDSSAPMEIGINQKTKKTFHIDQLLKLTTLSNFIEGNDSECLEYVRAFYERLDELPFMTYILQSIVLSDFLKIDFDFTKDFYDYFNCNSYEISIPVNGRSETEILGILAHEMTHAAMSLIYSNKSKPYSANDEDKKDEIERILFDIECKEDLNHEVIKKVLRATDESKWSAEIIACVTEIITLNECEYLFKNYNQLLEFFSRCVSDVKNFLQKFDNCTRLSVFSNITGNYLKEE